MRKNKIYKRKLNIANKESLNYLFIDEKLIAKAVLNILSNISSLEALFYDENVF